MTPRIIEDDEIPDDRRQAARRGVDAIASDGMPWQVKAAFLFGAPTVFAGYLIWALVSGIVPAILTMQATMNTFATAINQINADHQSARMQNETMLRVMRASCVNQAQDNPARERCLQ